MNDKSLRIEIFVQSSKPELLIGLDMWLNLDLMTDTEVKLLCRKHLTCPLPESVKIVTNFAPEEAIVSVETVARQKPNLLSQIWQSLKDELSVRWLLFLGVFLVVVSSGVLAATQWSKFAAVLQYGVLWAYTCIFWGVGFWASKQENLRLTHKTLQTIALLLIPVNFWAMDSFGLWRNPWQWLTLALAATSLTAITYWQKRENFSRSSTFLIFLVLSYLQWGWEFFNVSILAVYLGTILTTIIVNSWLNRKTDRNRDDRSTQKTGNALVLFALVVILVRAIFVVRIPIADLGLAIGICGWLLTKLPQSQSISLNSDRDRYQITDDSREQIDNYSIEKIFSLVGIILLFCGWYVCQGVEFPIQAAIVSILALHVFFQRLQRYWLRRDLLMMFAIGLQELFLIRELISDQLRQNLLNLSIQVANSQDHPYSIYSVTLFPYIIVCLCLVNWIYRQEKPQLARFGDWLTFGLGIILSAISLYNPTWRSLNLCLSTATLVWISSQRISLKIPLIYFAHGIGLCSITSIIDCFFLHLNSTIWAIILLVLMLAEFTISISPLPSSLSIWYESCWYLGLMLAGLSFLLFSDGIPSSNLFSLLWLLTPLALTIVARHTFEARRIQEDETGRGQRPDGAFEGRKALPPTAPSRYVRAASFSSIALIIGQYLTIQQSPTRFIALLFAFGLMFINVRYLQEKSSAALHVSFALGAIAAVFWDSLALANWFLLGAILVLLLWLLHTWLDRHGRIELARKPRQSRPRNSTLASIYAEVVDSWARILCLVELLMMTLLNI